MSIQISDEEVWFRLYLKSMDSNTTDNSTPYEIITACLASFRSLFGKTMHGPDSDHNTNTDTVPYLNNVPDHATNISTIRCKDVLSDLYKLCLSHNIYNLPLILDRCLNHSLTSDLITPDDAFETLETISSLIKNTRDVSGPAKSVSVNSSSLCNWKNTGDLEFTTDCKYEYYTVSLNETLFLIYCPYCGKKIHITPELINQ